MPRKGPAPRRDLLPDPVYRSVLVTQVVNKDNTTVVVAGCTLHWLFCKVAMLPSFSGPCHVPASLAR